MITQNIYDYIYYTIMHTHKQADIIVLVCRALVWMEEVKEF